MAGLGDWAESSILSHLLRTDTFTKPTVIAVALCSGAPPDSATGATIAELPNAGAYARTQLNPLDANWSYTQDPAGSGLVKNLSDITFTAASADWGWVSGIALVTSATYGAGNYVIGGLLTTPKLVGSGDQLKLSTGNISIFLD